MLALHLDCSTAAAPGTTPQTKLKTGCAQDAYLKSSLQNWYFHLYISRWHHVILIFSRQISDCNLAGGGSLCLLLVHGSPSGSPDLLVWPHGSGIPESHQKNEGALGTQQGEIRLDFSCFLTTLSLANLVWKSKLRVANLKYKNESQG